MVPRFRRNVELGTVDGEHGVITGQTRFGKTFLVKRIARFHPYLVVHAPKHFSIHDGETVISHADQLYDLPPEQYPIIIYRPRRSDMFDDAERETFCDAIFRRGRTTVIFDEIVSIAPANDFPPSFRYIYTQGAEDAHESGPICAIGLTQEPVRVPSFVFTQSAHHYAFYIANDDHRKKIKGFMPIEEEQLAALQKKEFYYWEHGMREAIGPCEI